MALPWKKTLAAAIFLATVVNAQTNLLVTATNALADVYQDGVALTPSPSSSTENWRQIDSLPIDPLARVVAISAYNLRGGCSGILASLEGHPHGLQLKTNGVSWKCYGDNPLRGWEELGFDDSKWEAAFEVNRNGAVQAGCPWIPVQTMPRDAYWIWTQHYIDNRDRFASCRGYTRVCQDANPCQNGGTCLTNSKEFCSCPYGFVGRFCETKLPTQSNLLVTATNALSAVYQDGVALTLSPSSSGNWRQIDSLSIDSLTRVVAIHATGDNLLYGCSGILASLEEHPYGLQLKTNSVSWKCFGGSPPIGWQELGFNDSSWEAARQVTRNGAVQVGCPWIPVQAMPRDAYWIWNQLRTNYDDDTVVTCRGYTTVCEDTNPCQNGGVCQINSKALCLCPSGFTGQFCETTVAALAVEQLL